MAYIPIPLHLWSTNCRAIHDKIDRYYQSFSIGKHPLQISLLHLYIVVLHFLLAVNHISSYIYYITQKKINQSAIRSGELPTKLTAGGEGDAHTAKNYCRTLQPGIIQHYNRLGGTGIGCKIQCLNFLLSTSDCYGGQSTSKLRHPISIFS